MLTLVIIHIILLSLSVLLTIGSAIAASVGFAVPKRLIAANIVSTSIGVASGIALLFSAPLDAKCAILFGYVLAFGLVHAYVGRRNQVLATSLDS